MQDYLSTLGILRDSRFMSTNREGFSGYQPRRNFRRGPGYGARTYGRGGRRMETAGNFYEVPKKVFNVPLPIGPLQTTETPQNPAEETPPLSAKKIGNTNVSSWSKLNNQLDSHLDDEDYPSLDAKNRSQKNAHVQKRESNKASTSPENSQPINSNHNHYTTYNDRVTEINSNNYHHAESNEYSNIDNEVKEMNISEDRSARYARYSNYKNSRQSFSRNYHSRVQNGRFQNNHAQNYEQSNSNTQAPGSIYIKKREDHKPNIVVSLETSSNMIHCEKSQDLKEKPTFENGHAHNGTIENSSHKNSAKYQTPRKTSLRITISNNNQTKTENLSLSPKKSPPPSAVSNTVQAKKIYTVNSDGSVTITDQPDHAQTNSNKTSLSTGRNNHYRGRSSEMSKPRYGMRQNNRNYENKNGSSFLKPTDVPIEKKNIETVTTCNLANEIQEKKKLKVVVTDITAKT